MSKVPLQSTKPLWVERMKPGCWYQISGDHPDLELSPTPAGTRYLMDTDPAGDVKINPAKGAKERLRRWLGRRPHAPWGGRCGFPSITEGWNGAVFASRLGVSGSMIVFGGGHNDYFGSDVHAFDLSTRQWSRISDGYVAGGADAYGRAWSTPTRSILTVRRCRRILTVMCNMIPWGMITCCSRGS